MQKLTLIKPDDAHLHLRDGDFLQTTVPDTAKRFGRAIVMPNLKPPITSVEHALAYRDRIIQCIPQGLSFQPLMTLYLTETLTPKEIEEAKASGIVHGVKLYPAGATTHSEAGISDLKRIYPLLEVLQAVDLPLLIHGESIDPTVDVFDREHVFLSELIAIHEHFPKLRIVLEHITTAEAVDCVKGLSPRVAATITAHHLLLNRNDLLGNGIRPHYFCLPILKRAKHQAALLEAATSGHPKFFLGTDSAPHSIGTKETACGCAGIYSAHAAIELYAQIFEAAGALDKLENFASGFAADFYQLPRNSETITLVKKPWQVPAELPFGKASLVPLCAGELISWQLL
ncbi:MAG: dihydroorotase [Gammaproteobacteria bacterium]